MLNTAKEQVIFLRMLGYDHDAVEDSIAAAFPGVDFEPLWTEATHLMIEAERSLDAACRREDQRAVNAEHDTSITMHRRLP